MEVPKEDIILIVFGITFVIAILGTFFFIIVIRNFNARRQKQKEIFEAILSAQEEERKRIAKDLHDQIGPMLAGIKLNLGQLNSKKETGEIATVVKEAQGHLDVSINDIRRISYNLVPRNIELQGLSGALNDYINYIQKAQVVSVIFSCRPQKISFNPTVDTNLFRIIQELINNTLRHADAKKIELEILNQDNKLSILLADDGKGFNDTEIKEGIGLKSIRNRAELYNGEPAWYKDKKGGILFKVTFKVNDLK